MSKYLMIKASLGILTLFVLKNRYSSDKERKKSNFSVGSKDNSKD